MKLWTTALCLWLALLTAWLGVSEWRDRARRADEARLREAQSRALAYLLAEDRRLKQWKAPDGRDALRDLPEERADAEEVPATLPNDPAMARERPEAPFWDGCAEMPPGDNWAMWTALDGRRGSCRTCHPGERDLQARMPPIWPPRMRAFGEDRVMPHCADWHPAVLEGAVRMDACRRCHPANRDGK